ncbi:collagen alpha-1(I) chain-like [Cololabis saira]|uniref:collagen alpha-1(I) chain-like n=1 Tax=Cololabis saira TaxID=129043 RepID=UPI002AD54365|nr:collagen alpha-1(I) chain-like [Cololabis saira]
MSERPPAPSLRALHPPACAGWRESLNPPPSSGGGRRVGYPEEADGSSETGGLPEEGDPRDQLDRLLPLEGDGGREPRRGYAGSQPRTREALPAPRWSGGAAPQRRARRTEEPPDREPAVKPGAAGALRCQAAVANRSGGGSVGAGSQRDARGRGGARGADTGGWRKPGGVTEKPAFLSRKPAKVTLKYFPSTLKYFQRRTRRARAGQGDLGPGPTAPGDPGPGPRGPSSNTQPAKHCTETGQDRVQVPVRGPSSNTQPAKHCTETGQDRVQVPVRGPSSNTQPAKHCTETGQDRVQVPVRDPGSHTQPAKHCTEPGQDRVQVPHPPNTALNPARTGDSSRYGWYLGFPITCGTSRDPQFSHQHPPNTALIPARTGDSSRYGDMCSPGPPGSPVLSQTARQTLHRSRPGPGTAPATGTWALQDLQAERFSRRQPAKHCTDPGQARGQLPLRGLGLSRTSRQPGSLADSPPNTAPIPARPGDSSRYGDLGSPGPPGSPVLSQTARQTLHRSRPGPGTAPATGTWALQDLQAARFSRRQPAKHCTDPGQARGQLPLRGLGLSRTSRQSGSLADSPPNTAPIPARPGDSSRYGDLGSPGPPGSPPTELSMVLAELRTLLTPLQGSDGALHAQAQAQGRLHSPWNTPDPGLRPGDTPSGPETPANTRRTGRARGPALKHPSDRPRQSVRAQPACLEGHAPGVPPQSNSPPATVLGAGRARQRGRALDARSESPLGARLPASPVPD